MTSFNNETIPSILFGKSLNNVFFRLIFILAIIGLIWSMILLVAIVYNRYRRTKRQQNVLHSAHHLYDNQFNRTYRYGSSSTTVSAEKWYSFARMLPVSKTSRSISRANSHSPKHSVQIHAAIEAMSRRSLNCENRLSVAKDESPIEPLIVVPERKRNLEPSLSIGEVNCSPRRFSNIEPKLEPTPLSAISLRRDLSLQRHFHWPSPTETERHLPLVMITDTNSSFTNILELDTFDSEIRSTTDLERRLRQQLKTAYRPRYST